MSEPTTRSTVPDERREALAAAIVEGFARRWSTSGPYAPSDPRKFSCTTSWIAEDGYRSFGTLQFGEVADVAADIALAALAAAPGDLVAWLDEQIADADRRAEHLDSRGWDNARDDQEGRARALRTVRDRLTRSVSPEGDGAEPVVADVDPVDAAHVAERQAFAAAVERDQRRFANDRDRCQDCGRVDACRCSGRWTHVATLRDERSECPGCVEAARGDSGIA